MQATSAAETVMYGFTVALTLCLLHALMHASTSQEVPPYSSDTVLTVCLYLWKCDVWVQVQYTGLSTENDLELGSNAMSEIPLSDMASLAAKVAIAAVTEPESSVAKDGNAKL